MYVTEKIIDALNKAIIAAGSQNEFYLHSGVSQQNISGYLSGKTKTIKDDTWVKLEPFIRPYLSADIISKVAEERAIYGAIPQSDPVADPLFDELKEQWPRLTKSHRYRVMAMVSEFLEAPPKHAAQPAGEEPERKVAG